MENANFTVNDINYLLFVIPGFVVVWSYRFFARPKLIGEFEYAGLSFIWGMILLGFTGFLFKYLPHQEQFKTSPYPYTLWLSLFGFFLGWFGSYVSRWKWLNKFIDGLRPESFRK